MQSWVPGPPGSWAAAPAAAAGPLQPLAQPQPWVSLLPAAGHTPSVPGPRHSPSAPCPLSVPLCQLCSLCGGSLHRRWPTSTVIPMALQSSPCLPCPVVSCSRSWCLHSAGLCSSQLHAPSAGLRCRMAGCTAASPSSPCEAKRVCAVRAPLTRTRGTGGILDVAACLLVSVWCGQRCSLRPGSGTQHVPLGWCRVPSARSRACSRLPARARCQPACLRSGNKRAVERERAGTACALQRPGLEREAQEPPVASLQKAEDP